MNDEQLKIERERDAMALAQLIYDIYIEQKASKDKMDLS